MNPSHSIERRRTWPYLLTAVLITGILIRVFLIDSFTVVGNSMAPTIIDGDYVFVNKWAYRAESPRHNDIVVAQFRGMQGMNAIKRVVATPGEWIHIEQGTIYTASTREGERNKVGMIDSEDFVSAATSTEAYSYRLDPYEYFLMGDNGMGSVDSRDLGPVDQYHIEGRVMSAIRIAERSVKIFE